jgi:hypothetical protein
VLLARARQDERAVLADVGTAEARCARRRWDWLADPAHRELLTLWAEAYAQSLVDPDGPWAGFARGTVTDWLDLLAAAQPGVERTTASGTAARTAVLALLRGAPVAPLAWIESTAY